MDKYFLIGRKNYVSHTYNTNAHKQHRHNKFLMTKSVENLKQRRLAQISLSLSLTHTHTNTQQIFKKTNEPKSSINEQKGDFKRSRVQLVKES